MFRVGDYVKVHTSMFQAAGWFLKWRCCLGCKGTITSAIIYNERPKYAIDFSNKKEILEKFNLNSYYPITLEQLDIEKPVWYDKDLELVELGYKIE